LIGGGGRGGLFYAKKCKNLKEKIPSVTHLLNNLGSTSKIKIKLPIFLAPVLRFQKGVTHPCRTKTQEGDIFLKSRLFSAHRFTLEAD
jgi:hypothetical protein